MSNKQQRIRPPDVSSFRCICYSSALASLRGTQNLLGASTQSQRNNTPKSPIRTGATCWKFSTCSRVHTHEPNQRWNNVKPFVILRIINNNPHQNSNSSCASPYLLMLWGVYFLHYSLPPQLTIFNQIHTHSVKTVLQALPLPLKSPFKLSRVKIIM